MEIAEEEVVKTEVKELKPKDDESARQAAEIAQMLANQVGDDDPSVVQLRQKAEELGKEEEEEDGEDEEDEQPEEEEEEAETVPRTQYEALLARLENQGPGLSTADYIQQARIEATKIPPAQTQQQVAATVLEVASDQDIEAALSGDVAAFKKIQNQISAKNHELALLNLQDVVQKQVMEQVTLQVAVSDFYRENPALQNKRRLVGIHASEIQQQNPGYTVHQVLEEAKKRAYKELGVNDTPKKVAMASASGARRPVRKTSPQGGDDPLSTFQELKRVRR